jgi:hypothetical protein
MSTSLGFLPNKGIVKREEKNEGIESEQPRDPVFGETTELTLELDRAASKTCDEICSAPVNGQ